MTRMYEEPVSCMDEMSLHMLITKSVFIIVLSVSLAIIIVMYLYQEDTVRNGAQANGQI